MKITTETEFPKAWTDVETNISFTTHPYITSLYVAGNKGSTCVIQSGIDWKNVSKTVKSFRKMEVEGKIKNLRICKVGDFIDSDDLEIINS